MTDREAFEKWFADMMLADSEELTWELERNCYKEFHTHFAWKAWQACAEHYEAVMRRAVGDAIAHGAQYRSIRIGDVNAIIARAKND